MQIILDRPPKNYGETTSAAIFLLIQSRKDKVEDLLGNLVQNLGDSIEEDDNIGKLLKKIQGRIAEIYDSESERVKFRELKNRFIRGFLAIFPEIQFTSKYPRIDVILKIISIGITDKPVKPGKYMKFGGIDFRYGNYYQIVRFCRNKKDELNICIEEEGGIRAGWKKFSTTFNEITEIEFRGWVLPKNIDSITKKTGKTFREWLHYINQ